VFSCFLSLVQARSSGWGSGRLFVSSSEYSGRFFNVFSSDFLCQIYARPPTSTRLTPPSRVPRLRSHPLPEAQVTSVVARRVVFTLQRTFCSLAHVTVMLDIFWQCTMGDGVYGVRSAAGCNRWWHVKDMRRRHQRSKPYLHSRRLILGVFLLCFYVYSCLCFTVYRLVAALS
jgi:hypothetical protein